MEKLSHLVNVESDSFSSNPTISKLSYLEHRTMDLYKNHGKFLYAD